MKKQGSSAYPLRNFIGWPLLLLAGGLIAFPGWGLAGTLNVNLTDTTVTSTGFDGNGILGGGTWNRLNRAQRNVPTSLVKNSGVFSPITIFQSAGPRPDTYTFLNGNAVQSESWYNGYGFTLTVSGLSRSQFYRVAVYLDRNSQNGSDLITINGKIATSKNYSSPGQALIAMPGTEGIDYLLFTVETSTTGRLTVATTFNMAGIQIQGVLPGESGPKMDCMITTSPVSPGGRGRGVFGIAPNARQSLSQSGRRGVSKNFFVNTANTGVEYDKAFLMAFPDPGTRIRIIDKTTRRNVTAAARARNYRYDLNAGQTKGFWVQVSAANPRFNNRLNTGIGASPSTLTASRQDVVTCVLTP